jgi:hypothetical protein
LVVVVMVVLVVVVEGLRVTFPFAYLSQESGSNADDRAAALSTTRTKPSILS